MSKNSEQQEVLVVSQGFERDIYDFTMEDFRGDKLPNFDEPKNLQYRGYYRIEKYEPKSRCRWGYSRWITGEKGRLKMLDQNWDSSG